MWKIRKCIIAVYAFMFILAFAAPMFATWYDTSSYRSMTDKEVGQMLYYVEKINGSLTDFSWMDNGSIQNQMDTCSYRYVIANINYFFAIEQFGKIPAWREYLKSPMDRTIQKMLKSSVYDYWTERRCGFPCLGSYYGPGSVCDVARPSRDPFDENIMYSGHLGQMVGLYEMLYNDTKWDANDVFSFTMCGCWPVCLFPSYHKPKHKHSTLIDTMKNQMANNDVNGIACEPGLIYAPCVQHPILALRLFDFKHGTSYAAARESDLYNNFFVALDIIYSTEGDNYGKTAVFYDDASDTIARSWDSLSESCTWWLPWSGQDTEPEFAMPAIDGWTGLYMHPWKPTFVEGFYSAQYDRSVATVEGHEDQLQLNETSIDLIAYGISYGYFAGYAAEVGDTTTRDKLLNYVDANCDPAWSGDKYYYPIDILGSPMVTNVTGANIAVARALYEDALYGMFNNMWGSSFFAYPYVTNVVTTKMVLKRATWDSANTVLVVTTKPRPNQSGTTTFTVNNLSPSNSYTVYRDGTAIANYAPGSNPVPANGQITITVSSLTAVQSYEVDQL